MTNRRTIYQFADYLVDSGRIELVKNGNRLRISPTLFQILLVLLEQAGRIVSLEELIVAVWPAREIDDATVGRNVSQLRQILGGSARNQYCIETVPKAGYRFSAVIRRMPFHEADTSIPGDKFNTLLSCIQEIEFDSAALSASLQAPPQEVERRLRQFCRMQGLRLIIRKKETANRRCALCYRLERPAISTVRENAAPPTRNILRAEAAPRLLALS